MKILFSLAMLALLHGGSLTADAGVPHLLNYQGRVSVSGQNFTGNGQFKFALINDAATEAYWKNDGPAGNILVPPFGITIPVQNGHYSVQLGDTSLTNMQALPAAVFSTHSDVRLRVWFSDGVHGFQPMLPDQRIAAVGYAIMAEDVKDGAVTAAKLAAGAAEANLKSSGRSSVPGGGIIMSENYLDSNLINNGYSYAGAMEAHASEYWKTLAPAPDKRRLHTMVENEGADTLYVWGGVVQPPAGVAAISNTGSKYDIDSNTWTVLNIAGAPAARTFHTAVEIGSEMIVWGGWDGAATLGDGGRYHFYTNQWTAIPSTPALPARRYHATVATNTEMIVFGGELAPGSYSGIGARYNPSTGTWTQLPAGAGSPGGRARHTANIIGSKMYVWGGQGSAGVLGTGSIYDLSTNTWSAMSNAGAPAPRSGHCAGAAYSGDGQNLFIWGGTGSAGLALASGGEYHPATNTWTAIDAAAAPPARHGATLSFGSSSFLYWGGQTDGGTYVNSGGLLDYSNASWKPLTASSPPAARSGHSALRTSIDERIFFHGGWNGTDTFNDLYQWQPRRQIFIYIRP